MKKVEYAELATKKQFKKNLISTKIVEEMTTQNKNGSHLVLDSITLGSSKVYSENNISPVLIYIPQMIYSEYVEMFQSDGRCRIYHSTANRLLTSFKNKKKYFETIYLDYCCSFNLAMESISCLVDKIKQCDLFGVTISLRNYYSESEFGDYQFGLINKLQEITGINFKVLFGYSYRDTKQDGTKSGVMITIFLENQKGGNKE